MVARLRRGGCEVPLVLMGYLNPIVRMGIAAFVARAAEAGVDGCIVPDLPLEEAAVLGEPAEARGAVAGAARRADHAAGSTPGIGEQTRGFLYYVSVTGVTGARAALPAGAPRAARPGAGRLQGTGGGRLRHLRARAGPRRWRPTPTRWWWAAPWSRRSPAPGAPSTARSPSSAPSPKPSTARDQTERALACQGVKHLVRTRRSRRIRPIRPRSGSDDAGERWSPPYARGHRRRFTGEARQPADDGVGEALGGGGHDVEEQRGLDQLELEQLELAGADHAVDPGVERLLPGERQDARGLLDERRRGMASGRWSRRTPPAPGSPRPPDA